MDPVKVNWIVLHPAAFLRALDMAAETGNPEEVMAQIMDLAKQNTEESEGNGG